MKLITMTDFSLEVRPTELRYEEYALHRLGEIINYAKFLKRTLELGMFIPCDKEGNVLEEPNGYTGNNTDTIKHIVNLRKQFKEAKDRVLFEGLTFEEMEISYNIYKDGNLYFQWIKKDKHFFMLAGFDIERLIEYDLTLTPNAIKQLK